MISRTINIWYIFFCRLQRYYTRQKAITDNNTYNYDLWAKILTQIRNNGNNKKLKTRGEWSYVLGVISLPHVCDGYKVLKTSMLWREIKKKRISKSVLYAILCSVLYCIQ